MTVPVPVVVSIIAGLFTLVSGYATYRLARSAQREVPPAQTITNLTERLDTAEERLDASLRRERLRDDYIHQLRDHISLGKAPPPPPWPAGLTT